MTDPKPSPAWQGLRPTGTIANLQTAALQVEAILRRTMPSIIRLIEAFQALPPNTRRAVEQLGWEDELERWESEGGAL